MMLCKALQREASEWAATPLKSLTLFKREKMPHSSYTNTLSPIALLSLYLHAFIYFSTLAEDSLKHPQDSFGPQESSTWRVRWSLYNQASVQTTYIFIRLHLLLMKKQIRYNNIRRHLCAYDYRAFWANLLSCKCHHCETTGKWCQENADWHHKNAHRTKPSLPTILRCERLLRVWQEPRTNFHSLFKKYRLTFGLVRGFPTCIIPPVWIYSDATTTLLEWNPSTKQTRNQSVVQLQ